MNIYFSFSFQFIIAVVILALAAANASVLPLAYSPYGVPLSYAPGISLSQGLAGISYSAGPIVNAYHGLPSAYNLPSAYSLGPVVAGHVAAPVPLAAAAPVPVAVAAGVVPGASYVATTRGAVRISFIFYKKEHN